MPTSATRDRRQFKPASQTAPVEEDDPPVAVAPVEEAPPPAPVAAAPATPDGFSPDPEQRAQQHLERNQAEFAAGQREKNPFIFTNAIPDINKAGGRRYRERVVSAGERDYHRQVMEERAAEVQKRRAVVGQQKSRNAKLEEQYRSTGQQFYTDPFGDIKPIVEATSGRPLFHATTWEEGVHPKTGQPVLQKRDQYGQRQFKTPPIVASPDLTDDQLYYKFSDDDLRPAGKVDELVNHPNFDIARLAKRTVTARKKEMWKQAIEPLESVAARATIEHDIGQQRALDLQGQIDQLNERSAAMDPAILEEKEGGILGIGAKPTARALKAQQQRAELDGQIEKLTGDLVKLSDDLKTSGSLGRARRQASLDVAIFKAKALHDNYADLADERRLILRQQGKSEKDDPTLKSILAAQEEYGAQLERGMSASQREDEVFAPAAAEQPTPREQAAAPTPPPDAPKELKAQWAESTPLQRLKMMMGVQRGNTPIKESTPMIGSEAGGTEGGLFTIPKMEGKGFSAGVINAANKFSADMTSPENAALMIAGSLASFTAKIVQGTKAALAAHAVETGANVAFTAQMARDSVAASKEAYKVIQDPNATDAEKSEAVTSAILSSGMTAFAAKGAKEGGKSTVETAKKLNREKKAAAPAPETKKVEPSAAAKAAEARRAAKKEDPTAAATAAVKEMEAGSKGVITSAVIPETPKSAAESATIIEPALKEKEHTPPPSKSAEESAAAIKSEEARLADEAAVESRKEARIQRLADELSGGKDETRTAIIGRRKGLTTDQFLDALEAAADQRRGRIKPSEVAADVNREAKKIANSPITGETPGVENVGRIQPAELERVADVVSDQRGEKAAAGMAGVTPEELAARRAGQNMVGPGGEPVQAKPGPDLLSADEAAAQAADRATEINLQNAADKRTRQSSTGAAALREDLRKQAEGEPIEEAPAPLAPLAAESAPAKVAPDAAKPIAAAAVRFSDGEVRTGKNHAEIVDKIGEKDLRGSEDGFVTNDGKFVTREEAMTLAREAGQAKGPQKGLTAERLEYDRLQAEMKPEKFGTPEYKAAWEASEAIKNRNKGMPPGEVAGEVAATPAPAAEKRAAGEPAISAPVESGNPKKDAAPVSAHVEEHTPATVEGDKINKNWTAFDKESGTLGIPREEMPQIKSENRGALVQFLKARGIEAKAGMINPSKLKPTQAEFSPGKVQAAREHTGSERPLLISADNHVLDGHHQWMAALDDKSGTPMPVIKLNAPIDRLLNEVKEFPSTETAGGAKPAAKKVEATTEAAPRLSDRAIEALKKARISKPGHLYAHTPFTLAWDGAIDTAILAIRAGRSVHDAVKLAVERFKAKFPEHTVEDLAAVEQAVRDSHAETPAPNARPELAGVRAQVSNLLKKGEIEKAMTYTRDAVDNMASVFGREEANSVKNDLTRAFEGKLAESSDALAFAIEAGADRAKLAEMRAKVEASAKADPKWKQRALDAIDFADKNLDALKPVVDRYNKITSDQVLREQFAGFDTLKRDNYVMHKQDIDESLGHMFLGAAGEGNSSFRKNRKHETFADSIAAGVDPKSLNAVDLLQSRVTAGQQMANKRAWVESLKQFKDPVTKQPVAVDVTYTKRPDGSQYADAPNGYSVERVGNAEVAVMKGYEGIFSALTDASWWNKSPLRRNIQRANAAGKSINLFFDTFHLGRLAAWNAATRLNALGLLGGGVKAPNPFSYKEGLLTLDQTPAEIVRIAKEEGRSPAQIKELLDNKQKLNMALETGANFGKISDALHQDVMHNLPVTGTFSKWLFDRYQRGAMSEIWLMEYARQRDMGGNKGLTDQQVARKVSEEVNTRFGNLGRQGIFKSKTAQDVARLLFLAPQWNEGLIRSEIGAGTGAMKTAVDAATGKGIATSMLTRSLATMVIGQFVANQLLNQYTRGKYTWENPEEGMGAKLSAWIPDKVGGGAGFFLHPAGIGAEITHLLTAKYERTKDFRDSLGSLVRSRLSAIARPLATYILKSDALGRSLRPDDLYKEVAKDAVPLPIPTASVAGAIKSAASGDRSEQFPGQFQKQLMATVGLKTDQAPTPGNRIGALASEFNRHKGIQPSGEFYAGDYTDLATALKVGNKSNVESILKDLLLKKTAADVAKHFARQVNAPFTGNSKREPEFIRSLTLDQKNVYRQARRDRQKLREQANAALRAYMTKNKVEGMAEALQAMMASPSTR